MAASLSTSGRASAPAPKRHGYVVGERSHDACDDSFGNAAPCRRPGEDDELEPGCKSDEGQAEAGLGRLDAADPLHRLDAGDDEREVAADAR